MITSIQKWGNSLALRIPKAMAEDVQVEEGASVNLAVENGCLVVIPAAKTPGNLRSLLKQVTPENLHGEVDTGAPAGREVW